MLINIHLNSVRIVIPFVIGFSMTMPIYAANAVYLQDISFSTLQHAFQINLPDVAHPMASAQTNSLEFIHQHTDRKHMTHTRMQQTYVGFPVFGGYAIIHAPQRDKSLLKETASVSISMNGTVYSHLESELGQPPSSFIAQAEIALQQFKALYSSDVILEEQVTPLVYIDAKHHAVWAYKVSVLVQHKDAIPERPTAILEAKTFKPLQRWNDVKTSRSIVKAQGYGGNSRVGLYQYGVDLPFLQIMRDGLTGMCYMKNSDVKVVDMGNDYVVSQSPMVTHCEQDVIDNLNIWWTGYQSDGYDQRNGAYSPSNDALYIGSVIKNMYAEWYGINVLTRNNKPMLLVMRVHYGAGYENAFWDGKQMTFGDGDKRMYPLVSLGVGAHEISHGFTEQHSDLNYYGQSGGMNESFSDMAAQAAEFYEKNNNSWDIGHDIMKENTGYDVLRYMDKPSRDGRSIDRADQFHEGMNVHYSSGVYNRLFYLLANQPGWDVRQAFNVMLKANVDYWTPYSTFNEGACGVLNAARDLDLSVDAVKQSLDAVAIDYRRCI